MSTVTLSQNLYDTKKSEAIANNSLIKKVSLSSLELIDDSHVKINGYVVSITPDGYKSLIKSLGLPIAFTNRLEKLFNSKGKANFINKLREVISLNGKKTINAILSPKSKTIVGFSDNDLQVNNEQFFQLADKIIDGQGFSIVDVHNNPYNGGVSINAILDSKEHNIKGLSNEAFKSGLTISNSPVGGVVVSPYQRRLWCANGCTTQMSSDTYKLHDLSIDSQHHFFSHINDLRKNHFIPKEFGDTVRQANQTKASLAELERAHRLIEPFVGARAESIIPKERNLNAYHQMGVDPQTVNKKLAESNQSIWSLVNAITWTANNSDKVLDNNIQDTDRLNLQIQGGNLLDKNWDLQNTIKSPFQHLNPDEQVGLVLN
tara:strand:- start:1594 stop:2718 length:1125 start_codon:yes stop_codon:yes gene_type:complete